MSGFVIANARILTLAPSGAPAGPRRGSWLRELGVIERGWVRIESGRIAAMGAGDNASEESGDATIVIDALGRALLPGFVDCHTHACWAGNRFDEADLRLAGVPYLEILRRGGGIMSTVRATRAASRAVLASATLNRFLATARMGTTCIEAKSGYGLATDTELLMLDAIDDASRGTPQTVVPTFLGAHAKDVANPRFVDETIAVTLPAAARAHPGITCDAYCEEGAWSLDECRRYFTAARALGCPIRVHADQFHSLGMVALAIELGARSVDHLEATTSDDLALLAASRAIGVALPGCGFHLDGRYAPLRKLVDLGGAAAIATNLNPGSSPTASMPFIIALAARHLGLAPAEAIAGATVNAAHVLALEQELGTIEVGKRADMQLLASRDERTLAYEYAGPEPDEVWIGGAPLNGLRRS